MTSTLGRASTGHRLRGFATRRPEWFAVLTSLAYVVPPLALWLLAPEEVGVAGTAWMALVPAALLTVLGWWGVAGFTRRSTWRSVVPVLPLVLIFVVGPALPLLFGVVSHSLGYVTLVAVVALAVGFGYEATFRGVVLQALMPRGTTRAVIVSSVLSAAAYVATMAAGVDPVLVVVGALNLVGMGIAFAAVVVVTGTIWPLVLIDAAMQVPYFFARGGAGGSSSPGIVPIVIELLLGALAGAYGVWLLHRPQERHADHSGDEGQISPPQEWSTP